VIVFLMLGILAALAFLCVSPLITSLASHKSRPVPPSKPPSIRKRTFSLR